MSQNTLKIAHKQRKTLPLWRIKGSFVLQTQLSIGTGEDVYEEKNEQKDVAIANIALDFAGKPYIPGSAIKGALRALAYKTDADTSALEKIFGHMEKNETKPSQVEFCNAYGEGEFNKDTQTEDIPHSVRDRDYGTVVDRLFYYEKVVKQGYKFRFECTAQHLDETEIQLILGLLQLAGNQDHGIQLGGGKSGNNGRVQWNPANVSVHCLELAGLAKLWGQVKQKNSTCSDPWAQAANKNVNATPLQKNANDCLELSNLELKFHTPFLVYETAKKDKTGDPDGKPRKNNKNQYILPSSSLHGALRSQAEKILRTLGQVTHEGYKVPSVMTTADVVGLKNHAAILFGAPGWRAVVQCTDFFVAKDDTKELDHHMLAIDRLTGGGKDGAKFCVQALDCPTLRGSIRIDLDRLRKLEKHNTDVVAECLGLLAHVLRDLDEGDIALGYGKAKGYGLSHSETFKIFVDSVSKIDNANNIEKITAKFLSRFTKAESVLDLKIVSAANDTKAINITPSNGDFHNPYVFLPMPNLNSKSEDLPWQGYTSLIKSNHSHSAYHANTLSGRILCKLTTKTPIFIGAGDDAATNQAKIKFNFKLNGDIAIPATSLRGLVSSIHETISAAPLRVMENKTFSVRQDTGGETVNAYSSSAVGRVHINSNGIISIEPLTIPILSINNRFTLPQAYRNCFQPLDDNHFVYSKVLLEPQKMRITNESDYSRSKKYAFTDDVSRDFWYLPLDSIKVDSNFVCYDDDNFRMKKERNRFVERFMIGHKPNPADAYPLSQAEYNKLGKDEKSKLTRGFLRPMAYGGREMPPPSVRKYELFIPYPQVLDEFEPFVIPCTDTCVDRFKTLSLERYELQLKVMPNDVLLRMPYSPTNQVRLDGPLMPQHGDLVFFKPTDDGNAIAEISYSSIWRARLETKPDNDGKVYNFDTLRAIPTKNFAPLTAETTRNKLSPSELLFGFVQDMGENYKTKTASEKRDNPAKAFATKVRFGYGISKNAIKTDDLVTLKILASPKLPSPAMYFQPKVGTSNAFISKAAIVSNAEGYKLKGRKTYLHALRDVNGNVQKLDINGIPNAAGKNPWESTNPNEDVAQKVKVRPVSSGQDFYFEVDFNNVTQHELESILATIIPDSNFEHKIGMGKPLGLGSVKINVIGLFFVDRQLRYRSTNINQDRYHLVWKASDFPKDLPVQFDKEIKARNSELDGNLPNKLANLQMKRLHDVATDAYRALVLSGNPNTVKKPVHYPQLTGRPIESQIFEWFVNNAQSGNNWHGAQQQLASFTSASTSLPALRRAPRTRT